MANGRSWTGIGIGVGVAAVGGGLLWYLTRSGKASASPFTTATPPPPAPGATDRGVDLQPAGGPPLPANKPGIVTLYMNGNVFAIDGKHATPDQVVEMAKTTTLPIEVHLYLVDKALLQSVKDRIGKTIIDGPKWNTVGVVSIGGLVRSGVSVGRGVYR